MRNLNSPLSVNKKSEPTVKISKLVKNTDSLNKINKLAIIDVQGTFPATTIENISFFKCNWSIYKIDVTWIAKHISAIFT